jgi:hypothetical protein
MQIFSPLLHFPPYYTIEGLFRIVGSITELHRCHIPVWDWFVRETWNNHLDWVQCRKKGNGNIPISSALESEMRDIPEKDIYNLLTSIPSHVHKWKVGDVHEFTGRILIRFDRGHDGEYEPEISLYVQNHAIVGTIDEYE